jgi:hypothetical protein
MPLPPGNIPGTHLYKFSVNMKNSLWSHKTPKYPEGSHDSWNIKCDARYRSSGIPREVGGLGVPPPKKKKKFLKF